MKKSPKKARYGLLLIVLFSLAVSLALPAGAVVYTNREGLRPYPSDDVSLFLKRFDGITKELPADGTVGYLAEPGLEIGERDKRLFLTQNALIPRLVIYSTNTHLVVGDFNPSADGREIASKNGLIVVKDFGNGVLLLENEAR